MTYTLEELTRILKQSEFYNNYNIEPKVFGNLPIYVQINLRKE